MTAITFDVDEVGPLTFRRPGWTALAGWLDSFLAGQTGDASHNLCVECAVTPGGGELAALFEDGFGFLPGEIAGHLLEAAGMPGGLAGLGEMYPLVSLKEAEAMHQNAGQETAYRTGAPPSDVVPREMIDAARKRTRRPFFARTPLGWWACKAPGHTEAAAYEDGLTAALQGKGSRSAPFRALVLSCVLSHDVEAAKAQIEECPAIPYLLGRALRGAAGEGKAVARVSG